MLLFFYIFESFIFLSGFFFYQRRIKLVKDCRLTVVDLLRRMFFLNGMKNPGTSERVGCDILSNHF